MNAAPSNSDLANNAQRGSHWHHRLVRPLLEWWSWMRRAGWTMTDSGPINAGALGNIPKCAGKWEWQEWRHVSGKTKYIEV